MEEVAAALSIGDGVFGGDEYALVDYGCEEDGETEWLVRGKGEKWVKLMSLSLSVYNYIGLIAISIARRN